MDNGTADGAAGGAAEPPGTDGAAGTAGPWRNHFLILLDRIPLPVAVCHAYGEVLIANPAMAAQWGTVPGRLRGRNLLDLFRPRDGAQVERLTEALRLGHRSRYPLEVRWRAGPDEAEREGELTVDPVGDPSLRPPALAALLRIATPARRPHPGAGRAPWRPGSWRWPPGAPPRRRSARRWG